MTIRMVGRPLSTVSYNEVMEGITMADAGYCIRSQCPLPCLPAQIAFRSEEYN